jgi:aryl-alcohol dehydrogenase-like predicted oxidoreductase
LPVILQYLSYDDQSLREQITTSRRSIGSREVAPIGLGLARLGLQGRPPETQSIATVHAALDAGVTLLDTADSYSLSNRDFGYGEELVAKALASYGGEVNDLLIVTKVGQVREPGDFDDFLTGWRIDGRPERIAACARFSAARLGVEAIDLYQLHSPDPLVPFAESVGALADLLAAGTIRMAGISNVSVEQIDEAHAILGDGLASIENEYSMFARRHEPELRRCEELGLAFLAWSPLGGDDGAAKLASDPALAPLRRIAADRDVAPQQVALAWLLARSDATVPLSGATEPALIKASAHAADLDLEAGELAELDRLDVPQETPQAELEQRTRRKSGSTRSRNGSI